MDLVLGRDSPGVVRYSVGLGFWYQLKKVVTPLVQIRQTNYIRALAGFSGHLVMNPTLPSHGCFNGFETKLKR